MNHRPGKTTAGTKNAANMKGLKDEREKVNRKEEEKVKTKQIIRGGGNCGSTQR